MNSKPESPEDRRQLKNYVVDLKVQLKLFAPFFILIFIAIAAVDGITIYSIRTMNETVTNVSPELAGAMLHVMTKMGYASGIGLLVIGVAGIIISILQTHRILGPMVPIRRHLAALSAGDYNSQIKLRKRDMMQFLADDINHLTATLKQKNH